MNLYLNKRIDRTYLDAVLWRHKYPYVIVHPLPALPMYTRAHRETPRPSSTLHSNKGPRVYLECFRGLCWPDYLEQGYWFSGSEVSFTYLPTILVMQWWPLSFLRAVAFKVASDLRIADLRIATLHTLLYYLVRACCFSAFQSVK